MAKTLRLEPWHSEAAELMARTGCSLETAITELGVELDYDGCRALLRKAFYQRLLWEARHRYFSGLAKDPQFNQDTVIGKLLSHAQSLEEEGAYDKAAEVLLKLSKIKGWVGPESQVSIFGELSQRDLEAIRDKVSKNEIRPKIN